MSKSFAKSALGKSELAKADLAPAQRIPWLTVAGVLLIGCAVIWFFQGDAIQVAWSQLGVGPFKAEGNPLQADRAYGYLKDVCAIGPRVSATAGMIKQQELLKEFKDTKKTGFFG